MQRLWLSACLLCVASAGLCHAAMPAAEVPASVAADPLPSDPALIRGTLDNGLSYIIKKHTKPPQKVAMWIHLDTGSINETDRQRGLAHYLEHMSFNGSENFPPGKVVPFFESLGMTFGRDQNAFTSFDQTTYQLSLPDTKPETIDKGMTFFADILSRLSLVPTEIDNERAIITNEKTARKNVQQRVGEVMLEKMAPGSRFSQRLPIGTDESLAALNRDDFLDYYGKFYTASNATVIVVGDADPAVVEAAIKKNFGSAPKKPKPISETSGVKPYDKSFGVFVTDSELTRASVGVSRMLPMRPPTTTVEQLRQDFVETIAQQAFNRRMSDKVSRGGMPFEGAGGGISQQGRMLRLAAVNANGKPEQWREMLTTLVTEVQKARAFGFTDREVKDARREIMSSIERAARVEDTLPAQAILGRINSDLASGDTIMSSEQTLTQARAMFDGITTEEVSKYFGDAFDPTNVMYSVQLNTSGPTDAEVLKVGEDASRLAPSRDVEVARAETLMQTLPTPGTVTEQTEDKESGIWSGWLSNNTRVNYRFIDERKDTVAVTISLIGGELFETPANRGISNAASVAWGEPATKSLTGVDVRSLMNGRKVRVGGRAGADAMQLRITGPLDDLELGMQLAYLLLTEPKVEGPAFERWQTRANQNIDSISKQPVQMFEKVMADVRYPDGDVRQRSLTHEMVGQITPEAAQAWLEKTIAQSPIEVSIVGDLPKDKAIELATRYVGSLPSRERVSNHLYTKERTLQLPKAAREAKVEMETSTPQAGVMCGFYGPDKANIDETRAMTLASEVLSTRMIARIREKEQLVYGIGARLEPGDAYPGFGIFSSRAPCDPKNAARLGDVIKEMYAEFAKDGPTEEEMVVARKQIANTLDEQMKNPGFWSSRLETMTVDGLTPKDITSAPEAYQQITPQQVKDAFNKYYAPQRMLLVEVTPKAGASPAAAPAVPPAEPIKTPGK